MNEEQQAFHDRIVELLKRTQRLQEAVKNFAESVEDDQMENRDAVFATVGAAAGSEEGAASVAVAPARPEHGDALAPDYVDDQVDELEDEQSPRKRVEEAFNDVQEAADDVSSLVDDINIDDLLAGIDDADMQL